MFETGSAGEAGAAPIRGLAWRAYLALGLVGLAVSRLLPDGATRDAGFLALGFCAVAAAVIGLRLNRPFLALPWYVLLAGLTLLVAGDAARLYYGPDSPASLAGEVAAVSGHLAVAAMLILLVRQRVERGDTGSMLDAAVGAAGLGTVSLVFLMEPYTDAPTSHLVERLIPVAYPLLGALYVAVLAWLVLVSGSRPLPLYLFGAGLMLLVVCDALQAAAASDGTYRAGSAADYGRLLAYTLWGTAALHPAMGGSAATRWRGGFQDRLTARGALLLATAPLLVPAALAVQYLRGEPANVLRDPHRLGRSVPAPAGPPRRYRGHRPVRQRADPAYHRAREDARRGSLAGRRRAGSSGLG